MSNAPTNEFPFIMTTTPDTTEFSFYISAAGKFVIDWGDGNIEKINKNLTGERTISHSYNNAGAHKIKLGGKATGYDGNAAISFYKNLNLAKIDGSLGQIFSTLSDGTQPRFGSVWISRGTFQGCTNLTCKIPAELFSAISGAPASSMFYRTFWGCSGLSGNIPANLFAGIKGAPVSYMFSGTFYGCSNLSGNIPANLFAGITGAPAEWMFANTFEDCSNLTGSIPENLFAGIYGAPASDMFNETFYGCSGLSGTMDKLGNIKNKKAPSAVTATKKESKPVAQQTETKNEFPFIITTTPDTTKFSFYLGAAGNFVIDWGDGNIEKINKNKTGRQIISHSYKNAGAHKIKLGGKATGYHRHYTAISFYENLNLAKIDGSLGQIFSTLSDGSQPCFGITQNWRGTFQGCANLTGSIPENLFAGISGAPAYHMFYCTFDGCSNLSGSIPENLFAGIDGAPTESMFLLTFSNCSGLTGSIPENLFAWIKGAPASYMFSGTFSGCSGLTGSIPEKLFAGIKGAPAEYMFFGTFKGCSRLSGNIPENLFAGIEGKPAHYMFESTFEDCSNLSGSIPEKLFAGIYGAPLYGMFEDTFKGCSGLSGTMDELGNIKNEKAPSAVTATKQKESKPVAQQTETKQTSDTVSTDIKTTVSEQANLDIVDSAKIAQPDVLPTPETKKEQNVQTRKKRRKRHKRSRDVKPQQNSCENLIQGPKFTPVPDMGMTGTISVDIKISGITPDDLAKIIQMACSACNKPNIQITSDIVKHVQQNNLNQR